MQRTPSFCGYLFVTSTSMGGSKMGDGGRGTQNTQVMHVFQNEHFSNGKGSHALWECARQAQSNSWLRCSPATSCHASDVGMLSSNFQLEPEAFGGLNHPNPRFDWQTTYSHEFVSGRAHLPTYLSMSACIVECLSLLMPSPFMCFFIGEGVWVG